MWWFPYLRDFFHLGWTSLDEFCNLYSTMGIQNGGQAFLFIILPSSHSGKDAGNLSKDADFMNRVDIGDNVAIRVFVFE